MEIPAQGPLPEVRDLSDDEYNATYATGSGGHELPPEVLAQLNPEDPANSGATNG